MQDICYFIKYVNILIENKSLVTLGHKWNVTPGLWRKIPFNKLKSEAWGHLMHWE